MKALRCETCGVPVRDEAALAECLNCVLLDSLAQSGAGSPEDGSDEDEPRPSDAASVATSPRRYQHYEILTRDDGSPWELGHGAMGVTYKAIDVNLRVPVALKVINAHYSRQASARRRFLREARSAASLRHPNVASVFHFGTISPAATTAGTEAAASDPVGDQGECFYTMEFVEGETLQERLRRTGPFNVRLTLEIALQITRALVAAEKRGLVHRDLKPANIMLTAGGGDFSGGGSKSRGGLSEPWIKVIDFGLAKAINTAAVGTRMEDSQGPLSRGGFMGTPQFASPEQFGRTETDVRSDVFSLGAVLWYLLTGNLLFNGRSLDEIRDQQLHRPLPLDQLTAMHVPAPFVELLGTMLAADPAKRPASAADLHERLEGCLSTQPLPASTSVAGTGLPPRRGRPLAAVGVLAFLLLLAAAGVTIYLLRREPVRPAQPTPVDASSASGPRVASNGTILDTLPPPGRSQILYVTNFQTNSVGMYDGFTGLPLNPELVTGLSGPNGIVVAGSKLYVANETSGTVGMYNSRTGAPINPALISGLSQPVGLTLAGSRLYVTDAGTLVVSVYDAATGTPIKAPLIGGLLDPEDVVVSGDTLYVIDSASNKVATYDATTGATINASFIKGLKAPYSATLSGNRLVIANHGSNTIAIYDATTGAAINEQLVTTLLNPYSVAVYNNTLYATDYTAQSIGAYDSVTGEAHNAKLITGLHKPNFIAVVPPLPSVTLHGDASPIRAAGGETGEFTLNLSAPQSGDVLVRFKLTGSAVNGSDYELIPPTAKIEAGTTSQSIKIVPLPQAATLGGNRIVKLDLEPGDDYTVRSAGSAEVNIVNQ